MEKVPWALLSCLAGIAFLVYAAPGPSGPGILYALLSLAVLAVLLGLSQFLLDGIFEGRTTATRVLAAGVAVLAAIAYYWIDLPDLIRNSAMPANTPGWMLLLPGIGWIVCALYQHFNPGRPVMTLSPAGIHARWLGDLLIPWHEIQDVAPLEFTNLSGGIRRNPDITVILVSKAFYERYILPRRHFLTSRDWTHAFRPKGSLIQMLLLYKAFAVAPNAIREPVEARWKAFRGEPSSRAGSAPEAPLVYGIWSLDGSHRQAVTFLVPLIAIAGVLAHAAGLWPR